MDANDIFELSLNKKNLAINSYIICLVLISIVIISIVFLIKNIKKKNTNKILKLIMPVVWGTYMFFLFFIEGVNAQTIAVQLNKDSQEMKRRSTSGVIEDMYAKAKTDFIVIDSKSYIYDSYYLQENASVGENFRIDYLIHSGFIKEMKEND